MKKNLFIIFVILCYFIVNGRSFSQDQYDYTPKSSLLWEISRTDIPYKSYIFGTNHFFSSSLIDTSTVINSILGQVNVIVPEVSLKEIDSSGLFNMMLMGKDDYYSFSSKEDEENLYELIRRKTGIFPEYFLKFKPIIVYITLLFLDNQKNTGNNLKSSSDIIDNYFQIKANQLNKELIPLEGVEFQIGLLTEKISIKDQLKILLSYSALDTLIQTSLIQLDSCYKSFDLECIKTNEVNNGEVRLFNKYFIDERNINWMKILPGIINIQSSMIVVGAGHLPGKNGIIELLKQLGYVIKPVKFW